MMNMRYQINQELAEIHMSEELKRKIKKNAVSKVPLRNRYMNAVAIWLFIIIVGCTTVFAEYLIYSHSKINVNNKTLPELDEMRIVEINDLDMPVDDRGNTYEEIDNYRKIQEILGVNLLNSPMADELSDTDKTKGTIKTDNECFVMINIDNYIDEDDKIYYSPVSLKVDIIINQEQLDIGWNVDYLGYYRYVESYVSSNGYKVNIIESTVKGDESGWLSKKCAVFVADGIYYTVTGRMSMDDIKYIVDTMSY